MRANIFGQEYEKFNAAAHAFGGDLLKDKKKAYISLEIESTRDAIKAFQSQILGFNGL